MVRRRSPKPPGAERRKRVRRSDEQLIGDLEAKILDIRRRAEARQARESPSIRSTLRALRSIDKAIDAAESEGDTALRHVLSDGREPLAAYLQSRGVQIRKARRPKGRRPNVEEG